MHLDRFRSEWIHTALAGRPRILTAVVAMLAVVVFAVGGWAAWFSYDLTAGLPNRRALGAIGDMAQATTILDANDKPAFTIFKEQRIEVPHRQDLAEHDQGGRLGRGSAVLRAQRRRRRSRRRRGREEHPGRAPRRRRQHDHAAARAPELPQPRQDVPPEAEGSDSRRRTSRTMYSKNEILELYLNKVYFGDGLYGVEAASRGYFGKHASDLDDRRSGAARRPDPVAVELRADRQPRRGRSRGATSCCRRWSRPARSIRRPRIAREERGGRARERPRDQGNVRPVFQGTGPARARRALRLGARLPGRAPRATRRSTPTLQRAAETLVEEGLSDIERRRGFRHEARGKRPAREGRGASGVPAGRARRDGSRHRRRSRDGRRPRFRREPLQPRHAGEAAVRLGVQAVRLCRRARGGLLAGVGDHAA